MKNSENWGQVYSRLLDAQNLRSLAGQELEALSVSSYMLGKDSESFDFLEKTYHQYIVQQAIEDGARISFWLGFVLMNAGEKSRGSGWIAAGSRLCDEQLDEDSAVKGFFPDSIRLESVGE